jgi:hypothetical protein
MLVAKLLPFVKNLSTRKWSDEDIVEDVQYLKDELTANFRSLTYAALSNVRFSAYPFAEPTMSMLLNFSQVTCRGHPSTTRTTFGGRMR